jgi:hypothetical protein
VTAAEGQQQMKPSPPKMNRSLSLLLAVCLTGCTPDDDDDDVKVDDTSEPSHDDSGDSGDTALEGDAIQELSWQVHDEIGSLIVVSWEQLTAATVHLEFQVDDDWLASPSRELDTGPQQELLLGVPYDHDVSFRVVVDLAGDAWTSDEQLAHTGEHPQLGLAPSMLISDASGWEPTLDYVLLTVVNSRGWTVIVDRQGRLVWASQTPPQRTSLYSRPSFDGTDILVDHNSFWQIFDGGAASQVQRMKIDGSVVDTYDTPGLHHPFLELGDGSLVWSAARGNTETVEKLTPAGDSETLWSCREFLDELDIQSYCGSNTLSWNQTDDTILISLYSQETIVEFDHATGETLRYFGHAPGAWQFDPPESAFYWQHGGHFTEAGTLITSSHVSDSSDECVVREYSLDASNEVLQEVWSFGVGLGVESESMGEVHRLPSGNTLHNYGAGARLREVTPDGTVVWDLEWQTEIGRSTPLENLYALAP